MSLKYFHIFFITVASLLCFFFGFWSMERIAGGENIYFVYAVVSFTAGAGLILYGRGVWQKLKGIGFFSLFLLATRASTAWSCATCYGNPDSPTSKALVAAVVFLLATIIAVLGGFLALIVHYNRRSRDLIPS